MPGARTRLSAHEEHVELLAVEVAKVAGIEVFAARTGGSFVLAAEVERLLVTTTSATTITPLPTVASLPSWGLVTPRLGLSCETPQAIALLKSHSRFAPISASSAS